MVGRATIRPHTDDKGVSKFNLRGFTAVPGSLALANIYYDLESDRQWAIDQWHALRFHDPRPPERRVVDGP